ncbi:MAG: HD domain-containing protein [Lachnospiraceae bacterium]|nr:HD domain-containing protein [Lachnospiraceae bacterium]
MAVKTFAAIDVGSYEISMKIYEISPKHGMREIDHLRRSIDMGTDTYTTGKLSYERVDELCRILKEFRTFMDGYKVVGYQAYGTSAFREAENAVILLDQINTRTGIRIVILSNSEQRFFHYKAVAFKEEIFTGTIKSGAAIIDIGSGSIQISLFEDDTLVSTQNLRLGVLRLREHLTHLDVVPSQYEALLNEIIDSQLRVYKKLYLNETYKNVIIVDDYISAIIIKRQKKAAKGKSNKLMLEELLHACNTTPISELARILDVPEENIILLQISGTLLLRIMEMVGAEFIWAPGTTLCDGVAYDYAEKQKIIKPSHDFEQDIITCTRNISKRYRGSKRRGDTMEMISLTIFDSLKKIHGMGKRERLLLRLSALLHDCGKYISIVNLPECSYGIVMATEIIGISEAEQIIIANIVKYNHQDFDYFDHFAEQDELDRTSYLIVAKLTAILRVANGLDRSNRQKVHDIKAALKENELILTIDTDKDIALEKGLFEYSSNFFEEVFSIRPTIKRRDFLSQHKYAD